MGAITYCGHFSLWTVFAKQWHCGLCLTIPLVRYLTVCGFLTSNGMYVNSNDISSWVMLRQAVRLFHRTSKEAAANQWHDSIVMSRTWLEAMGV
jgi:hypothetical protein